MRNYVYTEKVKVAFVACEKKLIYFLKQNSLMSLVQLTLPGNFETKTFQICFFNLSIFVSICLSSHLLKQIYLETY